MQIRQRSSIEAGKALCYNENLMEIYEILAQKFMRQINGDGETKGWRELIPMWPPITTSVPLLSGVGGVPRTKEVFSHDMDLEAHSGMNRLKWNQSFEKGILSNDMYTPQDKCQYLECYTNFL
ncbi:hypothetical protein H5410_062263 [Solanum commersonii]|uniref:Uncharacterized protein n=1 Tax=Solanum commersonii TaxID=4109 RepID=A0A9J5WA64_SOLCO|nr:hypothetical protein H5410_062263 [Solanum commersonii]